MRKGLPPTNTGPAQQAVIDALNQLKRPMTWLAEESGINYNTLRGQLYRTADIGFTIMCKVVAVLFRQDPVYSLEAFSPERIQNKSQAIEAHYEHMADQAGVAIERDPHQEGQVK